MLNQRHLTDILHYHEETKHQYNRFARSMGYLDWANQPNPFRFYHPARRIALPLYLSEDSPFANLFTPGAHPPCAINPHTLSDFFRFSLGLSAWKQYGGDRWALRVNPSSGNLHPTEAYTFLGAVENIQDTPSVLHYIPETHELEVRAEYPHASGTTLLPDSQTSFLVALSSIHWREAWKYGERAFRYCNHDVGHALAALRFSAALQGWNLVMLPHWTSAQIAALFGLDRHADYHPSEREEPDFIALVTAGTTPASLPAIPNDNPNPAASATWYGTANTLSHEYHEWPIIDAAADATAMTATSHPKPRPLPDHTEFPQFQSRETAKKLILQRRSAQEFDPQPTLALDAFCDILLNTQPRNAAPWDALFWEPQVHLLVFVHRVEQLKSGMYLLVRNNEDLTLLQKSCRKDFAWKIPKKIAPPLSLYLLREGDMRETACQVSCGQSIAGNSFFSLGMIAKFEPALQTRGAWFYKNLFWETGVIGQVLYLAAENAGARGTGIGCFFDDAVHELLGLKDQTFQSLYHFTIGIPLEDARLSTLPPYPHDPFFE